MRGRNRQRLAIGWERDAAAECAGRGVIELGQLGARCRVPQVDAWFAHGHRRDGVARRFGQGLLDEIDRARGALPDPRPLFVAPEHYHGQVELPSPVEEAPAFKAHDMLGQLLVKQGDRNNAAEEFRAALALAHAYSRAQEDLKRVDR